MKIPTMSLTLNGDAAVLASVLNYIAGLPVGVDATIIAPMPSPVAPPLPSASADDDDNGPVNTAAPATDVNGLPHDERIHSENKAIKADGSWRRRRGVSDELVASVEAELRARNVAPLAPPVMPVATAPVPIPTMPAASPVATAPAPAPVMPPIPPMPAPVAETPAAPAPVAPPMPAPIPAPVVETPAAPAPVAETPAPVAPPAADGALDFAGFMLHLQGQMAKRDGQGQPLVHTEYLAGLTAEISTAFAPQGIAPLTVIMDIATNPQMITYAVQAMTRDGRW